MVQVKVRCEKCTKEVCFDVPGTEGWDTAHCLYPNKPIPIFYTGIKCDVCMPPASKDEKVREAANDFLAKLRNVQQVFDEDMDSSVYLQNEAEGTGHEHYAKLIDEDVDLILRIMGRMERHADLIMAECDEREKVS